MAMALAPENLTTQEIAERTRLPLRALSTQINRLIEQGYLGYAEGEGGKGTIYEVSDGLFRLWYQYRKGRKVLQPIVRFLALLHPAEDLLQVRTDLEMALAGTLSHLEREILETTIRQVEEAIRFLESEEGRRAKRQLLAEDHFWTSVLETLKILGEVEGGTNSFFDRLGVEYANFLKILLIRATPERFRDFENVLRATPETSFASETARIYLLVLRVLEPTLQGRKAGQPDTARRSLARVPPELRKTVELTVAEILAERRSRQKLLSRPG